MYRTMALSAIPPSHPRGFLALEAARRCLRNSVEISKSHKNFNNDYAWVVYCHWMLLHSPVTPFMSVVGHVIANPLSSADDLELLQEFVNSLQSGIRLSEEVEKFHRLCSIFVRVAQAYVQAKVGNAGGQTEEPPSSITTREVDESLATLGLFVPQATSFDMPLEQQYGLLTPNSVDWFSGPMSLNELLEQDFLGQDFQEFGGIPFS